MKWERWKHVCMDVSFMYYADASFFTYSNKRVGICVQWPLFSILAPLSHQHHLSALLWSKPLVGEVLDVYHTCLRPKQQAGWTNKHQRTLRTLPHSFTRSHHGIPLFTLNFGFFSSFIWSPSVTLGNAAFTLWSEKTKRCSGCWMSVDGKKAFKLLSRFWLKRQKLSAHFNLHTT